MCYQYEVEFLFRKGLGPDFVTKLVPIAYDDVDAEVPEATVKQWAINEAREYLRSRNEGYPDSGIIYVDIHSV